MAILKFRAWHIKAKKYFKCLGFTDDTCFIKIKPKHGYADVLGDHLSDYIIEQSTGLHDSFGREIYEGDAVFTHEESESHYIVVWGERECAWRLDHGNYLMSLGENKPWKFIGNIHENPDLIYSHDA